MEKAVSLRRVFALYSHKIAGFAIGCCEAAARILFVLLLANGEDV